MLFATYLNMQFLFDIAVTFLSIFFIVFSGNCTRLVFDKKLRLNKVEILLSSFIVTIISLIFSNILLEHIPFGIFILFIFFSSAASYEITMAFVKNKVFKIFIKLADTTASSVGTAINSENDKGIKEKVKEESS